MSKNIIQEIECPVECAFLICNQARIAQDICTIEIYGNINHKRHTVYSCLLLAFEITQQIDAGNHRKIDSGIPEKAECFSETPFAMITHICQQSNDKIDGEKQYQPENVIPYRE